MLKGIGANPSFADPFKLRFVWLGTGGATPGAQPCTVDNADLSTHSQGQTTSVPEPSALARLFAAVVFRVARSSRALVLASRQDKLPCRAATKLANELRDDARGKFVSAGRGDQRSG